MKEKRKYVGPLIGWCSLTENVLTSSVETGTYNMGWFTEEWE